MRYTWEDRKDYLCHLVKEISDKHGGDDIVFLREYVKELINEYRDSLETVIRAVEALKPRSRTIRIAKDGTETIIDQ
jgi:hypothetical protein